MAFKIVYGAGQNLNIREGSGFGAGYGFLEMHQDEEVKKFALKNLERRLVGNSFGFERGPQWAEHETITISSFQKVDDWYVLVKIRPVTESRGRVYFLAEFLLINQDEAERLAELSIVPAAILEARHEDLWFEGELWDKPARWLTDPIDLEKIAQDGYLAADPNPAPEATPHRAWPAFAPPGKVWRAERGTPEVGWRPENLLTAMRVTQERFLDTYHDRFPYEKACFVIAWERCSLTNFYLDPSSGLDLDIGETFGGLPFEWTGVFTGIPMHQKRIDWAEADQHILDVGLTPDPHDDFGHDDDLIMAGWIAPLPETTVAPENYLETPVPLDQSYQSHTPPERRTQKPAAPLPKHAKETNEKKKYILIGVIALVILIVLGVAASLQKASEVKKELNTLAGMAATADKPGGGITSFINAIEGATKSVKRDEEFIKYAQFLVQYRMLETHLKGYPAPTENSVESVQIPTAKVVIPEHLEFTLDAEEPSKSTFTRIKTLWDFIAKMDGLAGADSEEAADSMDDLIDAFSKMQVEGSGGAHKTTASNAGLQWTNFERSILHNLNRRMEKVLAQAEQSLGPNKATRTPDQQKSLEALRDQIKEITDMQIVGEDATIHSGFLARATDLAAQPLDTPTPPSNPAPGSPPPSSTPNNLLTRAVFMTRKGDWFDFPWTEMIANAKDSKLQAFRANPEILMTALSKARWIDGEFHIPLPEISSMAALEKEKIIVSKASLTIGTNKIATVNEDKLKFVPSGSDSTKPLEEQILVLIAIDPGKGNGECWIYVPQIPDSKTGGGAFKRFEAQLDTQQFLKPWNKDMEPSSFIKNERVIHYAITAREEENLGEVKISTAAQAANLNNPKRWGALLVAGSAKLTESSQQLSRDAGLMPSAEIFSKWFVGTDKEPASPISCFFAGLQIKPGVDLSKDPRPNVQTGLNKSFLDYLGSQQLADKSKTLQSHLADYLIKLFSHLGKDVPVQGELVKSPALFSHLLPPPDPLFKVAYLDQGSLTLELIGKSIQEAQEDYDLEKISPPAPEKPASSKANKSTPTPKQETPAQIQERARRELQANNATVMKENWGLFLKEFDEIRNFAASFDQLEPKRSATRENIQAYLKQFLEDVPKQQTDLDNFKKSLESGNLDNIQFRLVLTPQ